MMTFRSKVWKVYFHKLAQYPFSSKNSRIHAQDLLIPRNNPILNHSNKSSGSKSWPNSICIFTSQPSNVDLQNFEVLKIVITMDGIELLTRDNSILDIIVQDHKFLIKEKVTYGSPKFSLDYNSITRDVKDLLCCSQ